MEQGIIVKALSGFYYVQSGEECVVCRGRGKLRRDGVSPLVGDRVGFERAGDGSGTLVMELADGGTIEFRKTTS